MRIVDRVKELEILTGNMDGNYEIDYVYDVDDKITQERITGSITKTTTFTYVGDNIDKEIIVSNGKTITKEYSYDPITNNIIKIKITVF